MPAHPLSAIPAGSRVLLDADIFIYAFTGRSLQCREIVERSQDGDVTAVTTIETVNEVCHKLMLLEALERGVIKTISASALRAKAAEIMRLTNYWNLVERIFDLKITILALGEARARRAHHLRSVFGLLTNDSLIAAAAQEQAIVNLATSDRDFDRIDWLTTYRPTDLPLMEPWYKVVHPRTKCARAGHSILTSSPSRWSRWSPDTGPDDYRKPNKFFSRTCFTRALREHMGDGRCGVWPARRRTPPGHDPRHPVRRRQDAHPHGALPLRSGNS